MGKEDPKNPDDPKPGEDGGEDKGKEHAPAEGSKRWNEVYGQMKDNERRLIASEERDAKRDEQFEIMKQHNADLQATLEASLENIDSKITSQAVRPDPQEDPAAYDAYIKNQVMTDLKKQNTVDNTRRRVAKPTPKPEDTPPAPTELDITRVTQIEIEKGKHPDYLDIVTKVKAEMAGDVYLTQQIMKSANPAKAAYDYGLKAYGDSNRVKDGAFVEGGGYPAGDGGGDPTALSEIEKSVARNMGITEKGYLNQKVAIAKKNAAKRRQG